MLFAAVGIAGAMGPAYIVHSLYNTAASYLNFPLGSLFGKVLREGLPVEVVLIMELSRFHHRLIKMVKAGKIGQYSTEGQP